MPIALSNVLHVPELKNTNLISWYSLAENGIVMNGEGKTIEISYKEKQPKWYGGGGLCWDRGIHLGLGRTLEGSMSRHLSDVNYNKGTNSGNKARARYLALVLGTGTGTRDYGRREDET